MKNTPTCVLIVIDLYPSYLRYRSSRPTLPGLGWSKHHEFVELRRTPSSGLVTSESRTEGTQRESSLGTGHNEIRLEENHHGFHVKKSKDGPSSGGEPRVPSRPHRAACDSRLYPSKATNTRRSRPTGRFYEYTYMLCSAMYDSSTPPILLVRIQDVTGWRPTQGMSSRKEMGRSPSVVRQGLGNKALHAAMGGGE